MAKINYLQSNFTAGELSPHMYSRTDTPAYKNGCRTMQNFLVGPFGGALYRPGLMYVAPLSDQTNTARLIPFQYAAVEAYVLEFTNTTIRFYRNQGIIQAGGGGNYSISSPYAVADIPNLRYAQTFDTLYIAHPSYPPYKLQRLAYNNWVLTAVSFDEWAYLDIGSYKVSGDSSTITLTPSDTTGSITVTASAALFATSDVGRVIRYQSGPDNSDREQYTCTGSQIYFDIGFSPDAPADVQVTHIDTTGARTLLTYTSGSPSTGQYTITSNQVQTGDTFTTSDKLEINRAYAGSGVWAWMTITAFTSSTSVTATVSSDAPLQGTNASLQWRLGAWSATTGYPSIVSFFQQRLVFANTNNNPNFIWGSAIGAYEDFSPDNALNTGIVDANSPYSFGLVTPAINSLKGTKVLMAGCGDSIIPLSGNNGDLSALDVNAPKDSNVFCSAIESERTAYEVILTEYLGKKIHSTIYDWRITGYRAEQINDLADHIIEPSTIKQVCYATTPYKILWVLRADGQLVSCTYDRDQQLKGWAQYKIGGTNATIESISVISGQSYSELWCVVKRTINGSTARYVEVMQPIFFEMVENQAFFVDAGLTYSGTAASTISGLTHLVGETVSVNVNGAAHPNCVVSNSGTITLQAAYTPVTVGLGYTGILETMAYEGGAQSGTSQGVVSRITRVDVRVLDTIGLQIGYDSTSLTPVIFRVGDDLLGHGPNLFSGYKEIRLQSGYNQEYKIYIEQNQPLPCNILGLTVRAEISDQ